MDLLTKALLEDLLDTQKTVAIYGGGFKPPTKGHFHVAELTLEQFPEIDELKIFVGQGVRDGVTQDESIKIWDIYKNYLSPKVDVEASVAPVKSVLGYAKENPGTKVYWILGARDGDEGDLADIENRTKSLSKYPNLEVKVITTSGGVSGTKTRQAIRDNNKEQFFHMIPDVNGAEKEEIWNMVSPIIKEGFMDDVKTKFQKFIAAIKQEGQETKEAVSLLIKAAKGDIELSDEQKEQIGNQLKDVLKTIGLTAIAVLPGGFIAGALIKLFKAEHLVTPSSFVNEVGEANLQPYKWEEIRRNSDWWTIAGFTTDSETQYIINLKTTTYIDDDLNNYKALDIDFTAKPKDKRGKPSYKIVVNKGELYKVMSTITDIIKHYVEKFKAKAITYSPSKKSSEEDFGTQRDNLYKAFISKAIPDIKFEKDKESIVAILPDTKINEVGEANLQPYKWKEVDRESYYVYIRFVTDSETQYDVDIKSTIFFPAGQMESLPALEIEFSAKPKGAEGSSAKIVVNKGEMYRVMATIVDIIKKYLKKSKAQAIIYSPSKKSSEESFGVQRDQLYRAFISKAIPGVTFKQSGDFVTAILPDVNEGSCGYDTDVATGKKLNTPGGLEEADPKNGTGKKPEGSGRRLYTDEDPKDTVRIKFKTKEDIVDTLNKTSFKAKSHARQSQVINLIHQRVRAAYSKSKDPEVKSRLKRALDYIESRKESSKEKTKRLNKMKEASDPQAGTALPYGSGFAPVKELVTDTEVICDNCGWEWKIEDGGKDLYICHKCGHDNTPNSNDPFGLNELARQFLKEALIETWNPEESFVSLSRYMIDNGMNIQPLPKIKVIKDDKQNASNLLGKTAYYNPVEKSITLYTMDRHPKDVLRSFAHEMIHHEQNLDGRLNNINTTNTNESGDLPEIEREAYEKGNMMLRNWEDKIKNV
jgi:hypothetical protein